LLYRLSYIGDSVKERESIGSHPWTGKDWTGLRLNAQFDAALPGTPMKAQAPSALGPSVFGPRERLASVPIAAATTGACYTPTPWGQACH